MTGDPMGEAREAARKWLKANDPEYPSEVDVKSPPVEGGPWVSKAVIVLHGLVASLFFFRAETPSPSMRAEAPSVSSPPPQN